MTLTFDISVLFIIKGPLIIWVFIPSQYFLNPLIMSDLQLLFVFSNDLPPPLLYLSLVFLLIYHGIHIWAFDDIVVMRPLFFLFFTCFKVVLDSLGEEEEDLTGALQVVEGALIEQLNAREREEAEDTPRIVPEGLVIIS